MSVKIGLVELPAIKLVDPTGKNYTALRRHEPLVSKQILIPQLQAGGYDVELVNLKAGNQETEYGCVRWRGMELTKVLVGQDLRLDPQAVDIWGVTSNYTQERDPACALIRALTKGGGRVIVGGSDAYAAPTPYFEAGAELVIKDKSGAANLPALAHLLGRSCSEPLTGVALASGEQYPSRRPPMSPEHWPLPSIDTVRQCMGLEYWEGSIPEELLPIGSAMVDIGCDRHCDFCQTPTYKLGYQRMSPKTALRWFAAQKEAGARSVICPSDQFLGRVLWPEGRKEVLEIMAGVREMGLAVLWGNGLELKKATLGRSLPNSDATPDEELVAALWGWDGHTGCYHAYLPAERPTFGRESYAKLLPWKEHCTLLRTIVRTGIPDITYGVIVGLPDDSEESLIEMATAITVLRDDLKSINPKLRFRVTPYAIRPLPGTPQGENLFRSGLLRFVDPAIIGGFWTACSDTKYMSYEQVSDWQTRLMDIGDVEAKWQGISGVAH